MEILWSHAGAEGALVIFKTMQDQIGLSKGSVVLTVWTLVVHT